jgi:hypothetical protein
MPHSETMNFATACFASFSKEWEEWVCERVRAFTPPPPPTSPSWAENTIMTECTQESGRFQSIYSLVCGVHSIISPGVDP